MSITLAGQASTQSRGRRPLPAGAVSARTVCVDGVRERVEFTYVNGEMIEHELLSWIGGQAGLLWGSGPYPLEVRNAIRSKLHQAQGSYGHAAEWALADALGEALDSVFTSDALSCRFFQDGGVAMAAAARVARHATGRQVVASCGYHGAALEWEYEPASAGIPQAFLDAHQRFVWGDVAVMAALAKTSAAICVEVPPVADTECRSFLAAVRQACDDTGAIFILDEVVTGFRFGIQGAAGRYGVKPDIACYGKAMSATGCVSAIVGRRDLVDLLDTPVFYSTTFGGSPGPCAVAAATVRWLSENAAEAYEHLHTVGKALQDGFNDLHYNCMGQPERSVCVFPTDATWLAWSSAMIERGVMVHRPQFPTLNHSLADVAQTLAVAAAVKAAA